MKRVHPLRAVYKVIDNTSAEDKKTHLREFPKIIELELTNICNFKCMMCKTGDGSSIREKGMMTDEIFDKMIAEIKDKDVVLKFVGHGESLLHPNFLKYAQIAKDNGILCHLTTNGSRLTEDIMQQLIDMKFDSVKFSFQGIDRESYLFMRRTDFFDGLMDVIGRFSALRGEKEAPYISLSTSVTDESEAQIEEFRNKCEKICDELEVGKTSLEWLNTSLIEDEKKRHEIETMKNEQAGYKIRYRCCTQVWDILRLCWNGDVGSCCGDWDGVMVLGNIKDNTLKELWTCDKQNSYREILAVGNYEALPLCKHCYDYMGYTGNENKLV